MRQAARNRSGPISPCSNGATKMPSGRRANRRSRLAFRMVSGRARRSRGGKPRRKRQPPFPLCLALATVENPTVASGTQYFKTKSGTNRVGIERLHHFLAVATEFFGRDRDGDHE